MSISIEYRGPARRVRFLERPNRYLARVRLLPAGERLLAHVPNPGRMDELLIPQTTIGYVVPAENPQRKTRFDLVAVRAGTTLVSIDSRVGNRITRAALSAGRFSELGSGPWRSEVPWEGHRLDFALESTEKSLEPGALLEVKCSNLRVGRTALFPDAPTRRGVEHLNLMTAARSRGIHAGVLFVLQRSDVESFAPNRPLDPEFAQAFDAARRGGVRIFAHRVRVHPRKIEWDRRVPVLDALPREPI